MDMKVILWDWNGTLLNDTPANVDIFNRVRIECGYTPVTIERYRELYRHPIRDMYADAGYDFSKHSYEYLAERWGHAYLNYESPPMLHEDAEYVLERLKERGARQSILSALPHSMLEENVQGLGISHHFEVIKGAKNLYGHSKIAEGVELALHLEVTGKEITVVGDSTHDAEVAQTLGAHCWLVSHGAESESRLQQTGFPVCSSLTDVYTRISQYRVG
jgi:phosphoglycolate phosphatase